MVVRQGLLVSVGGAVVGLLGAVWMTGFLESLLFGVSARDPLTLVGVTVGLLAVSLMASYLPARRAARVDRVEALRQE